MPDQPSLRLCDFRGLRVDTINRWDIMIGRIEELIAASGQMAEWRMKTLIRQPLAEVVSPERDLRRLHYAISDLFAYAALRAQTLHCT